MGFLKELLTALHVSPEVIEAYSGEELPENASELVQGHANSRIEFYKSSDAYKTDLTNERNKTFAGTQLSVIKNLNTKLGIGLSNTEMKEFKDVDSFMVKVKSFIKTREEELATTTDEKLLADVDLYKGKSSDYKTKLDAALEQVNVIKASEKERTDNAIMRYQAKDYYNKMVGQDEELGKLDIPGKAFTLDSIRTTIFSSYKILPEGKVLALDGTAAIHPEKDVNIGHVSELFEYYKSKAGLIKRSNAGQKTVVMVDGKPVVQKSTISAEIAAKMDKLKKKRFR